MKSLLIQNQLEHWCVIIFCQEEIFLFSTGTGLAPFMSIVRDPETYEKFEKIILTHTVRKVNELAYKDLLDNLNSDDVYREVTKGQFIYFNTVTRETWEREGRITDWITNKKLWSKINVPEFNPSHDRVMICGSESTTFDLKKIFEEMGFQKDQQRFKGALLLKKFC